MLRSFRSSLDSWVVRIFFGLLALAFMGWGVGDMLNVNLSGSDVATIGDQHITADELQDSYRRQMQQLTARMGDQQPSAQIRTEVAREALDHLLNQSAVIDATNKLGLAVSDAALREAVFAIPAFKNAAGAFDRTQMLSVLSNNGLNEARFLALMRSQLLSNQLLGTLRGAVVAPPGLVNAAYDAQHETRQARVAAFDFAAAPPPPPPARAELERWWTNHPDLYSTPEYRHITAIVLAPESVARSISVSEPDIAAWYEQHRDEFNTEDKRSAEIVMMPPPAAGAQDGSAAIAALWRSGASWDSIEAAATQAHDTPLAMTDFTASELPDPTLAAAVFAAPRDNVIGPVQTALGTALFRVTAITQGRHQSLAEATDEVRGRVAAERANDLIYDRANKVEDLLAGGAKLTEMPDDLGLVGAAGTLDATGTTPDGTAAPLPGSPALRAALLKAAFEAKPADPPRLIETADHAYIAVSVDSITPPAARPFDSVAERVLADWTHEQLRQTQNVAATKMLTALRSGATIDGAARGTGARLALTPPISLAGAPPAGVAPQIVGPLFAMKQGAANMAETDQGFLVFTLADIHHPDPAADPAGVAELTQQIDRSIGDDMEMIATAALRARGNPRVNLKLIDQIAQP